MQPKQISMLDETMVEQLIKELPMACPTVHTLVVADKTYKLSGGLNIWWYLVVNSAQDLDIGIKYPIEDVENDEYNEDIKIIF